MEFARAVDQVISAHMTELSKPGVLSVRPGYQAAGQWLTKKPAIVVTVDRKRDDLPPDQRLPETLGGFPGRRARSGFASKDARDESHPFRRRRGGRPAGDGTTGLPL
jgi:hypothetical protein